ncbi:hypothetical protein GCM10010271_71170 [Streptomyces kurssanovii]|nr:hypothetical protein GCM10010271_71170 [Streptomyces kurssanovii]
MTCGDAEGGAARCRYAAPAEYRAVPLVCCPLKPRPAAVLQEGGQPGPLRGLEVRGAVVASIHARFGVPWPQVLRHSGRCHAVNLQFCDISWVRSRDGVE